MSAYAIRSTRAHATPATMQTEVFINEYTGRKPDGWIRSETRTHRLAFPPPATWTLSYWNGRSPHTLAAYRCDIEQFCDYLTRACGLDRSLPQLEKLRVFFGSGAGRANELVLNYRSDMRNLDKAPKTINRRLAAIRRL